MRPEWEVAEFEALLRIPTFEDVLAAQLVGRSADEVVLVRHGIHAYHRVGKDKPMLSSMMLQRLRKGDFTCRLCCGRF